MMPNPRNMNERFANELLDSVCKLVGSRHVYQTIDASPTSPLANEIGATRLEAEKLPGQSEKPSAYPGLFRDQRWTILHHAAQKSGAICVGLHRITLVCYACGKAQPHDCLSATEFPPKRTPEPAATVQEWCLSWSCNDCDSVTSFLVRRKGWKLTLCGRSPAEPFELDRIFPKDEARYFGQSIQAARCNHLLAATCVLRIAIEQFMRRRTSLEKSTEAKEIVKAYGGTLPPELSSFIPSLGECYADLSAMIHAAHEDADAYIRIWGRVHQRFKVLETHRLPR